MDEYEDQMLASSMQAFTAAAAGHVTLPALSLGRLLVALDGSDQDPSTRALAALVAARTGAAVLEAAGLRSAQEVLQAATMEAVGLIIMDAPFGEDFGVAGHESLGTAVDLVLSRSTTPVLVIREPAADLGTSFQDILIPIVHSSARTPNEVAWALALTGAGGRVEVLDVPDLSVVEEAKLLLGDAIDVAALREEALRRTAQRDAAPLVNAAREVAAGTGVEVVLTVEVGQLTAVVDQATRGRPRLLITTLPGSCGTPDYHRARDLALRARWPVLFV